MASAASLQRSSLPRLVLSAPRIQKSPPRRLNVSAIFAKKRGGMPAIGGRECSADSLWREGRLKMNGYVLGDMSLGGNITPVESIAECLQVAFDAGGKRVALPMSSAKDIPTIPAELFTKFQSKRQANHTLFFRKDSRFVQATAGAVGVICVSRSGRALKGIKAHARKMASG